MYLAKQSIYVVGISSYRLLNFDDNFEKNEVLAELRADVSCKAKLKLIISNKVLMNYL